MRDSPNVQFMTTHTDPVPPMRALRIAVGVQRRRPLPLSELAEKVGYSESHLRSVENGNRAADAVLAQLLVDELGVDSDVDLGIRLSGRSPRETRRPEPSRPADTRPSTPPSPPSPKRGKVAA